MVMKTSDETFEISAAKFSEYIDKVGQWPPPEHSLTPSDEIDMIKDNK